MSKLIYNPKDWDNYAGSHLRITSRFQYELYQACSDLMSGDVIDCGCGSGKMAPFLCKNPEVSTFTGIDCSENMVTAAAWLIDELKRPGFNVQLSLIEDFERSGFSAGLSVNSYYAWQDPAKTLTAIAAMLAPNAIFVLANPNPSIDMQALLNEASKELIGHPDFSRFSEQNLAFVSNQRAHFVEMDELIDVVRAVGFKVLECHQKFYQGGINFLHLQKAS